MGDGGREGGRERGPQSPTAGEKEGRRGAAVALYKYLIAPLDRRGSEGSCAQTKERGIASVLPYMTSKTKWRYVGHKSQDLKLGDNWDGSSYLINLCCYHILKLPKIEEGRQR